MLGSFHGYLINNTSSKGNYLFQMLKYGMLVEFDYSLIGTSVTI
jgi:hypothetical protein